MDIVSKHRSKGIVLDTNILLMLLVGRVLPSLIERFDRTSEHFTEADYHRLNGLLRPLQQITTTAHILAETSNLGGQIRGEDEQHFWRVFSANAPRFRERTIRASTLLAMPEFARFGLADCAMISLARAGRLIITVDAALANRIEREKHAVINYTNISYAAISEVSWQ